MLAAIALRGVGQAARCVRGLPLGVCHLGVEQHSGLRRQVTSAGSVFNGFVSGFDLGASRAGFNQPALNQVDLLAGAVLGAFFQTDDALLFAVALQRLLRLIELFFQARKLLLQPHRCRAGHLVAGVEVVFYIGLCQGVSHAGSQCGVSRGKPDDDQLAQPNGFDAQVGLESTQRCLAELLLIPYFGLFHGGKSYALDECCYPSGRQARIVLRVVVQFKFGNSLETDFPRLENFYLGLEVLA